MIKKILNSEFVKRQFIAYSGRKFVLFVLVLSCFLLGWFYTLHHKESLTSDITWAIIIVLGMYAGTNLTEKNIRDITTIFKNRRK